MIHSPNIRYIETCRL